MYARYTSGLTLAAVGREFGVTPARVSQLFAGAGLGTRPRGPRADPRLTARTAQMYEQYLRPASLATVGREFGVTAMRVSQLFAAARLDVRPQGPRLRS
jgi:DNA-directed RNA polymerase sigma subunit (sigma70/sigma32)